MPGIAADKPTVYAETTIVSYLTARPTTDVLMTKHQELTKRWWDVRRADFAIVISPRVIAEAELGDSEAAQRRVKALDGIDVLPPEPDVEALAGRIWVALQLPQKARVDAVHLAYTVHYEIDYLLTWNCTHLAGARSRKLLTDFTRNEGLWLPVLCTPIDMLEGD